MYRYRMGVYDYRLVKKIMIIHISIESEAYL